MLFSELTVDVLTNVRILMYYTAGKPILQGKDFNKNNLLYVGVSKSSQT
jgi:hypothetical protein